MTQTHADGLEIAYLVAIHFQTKAVERLERLTDEFRGSVQAEALPEWSNALCSCDQSHGFGLIAGPEWFDERCLGCAERGVKEWLADPGHGPDEVLSLDVFLAA